MTDAFDQLKSAASTAVGSQIQKQEGWVKTNRKGLIIGAGAMLLIWAVAHHFGFR